MLGKLELSVRFLITGLPMPPSVNDQYYAMGYRDKRTGKIRGIITPSESLKAFQKAMEEWTEKNYLVAGKSRVKTEQMLAQGKMLKTTIFAVFPSHQVWTQAGKPRKMDVSNRMKPLEDAVAKILLIDDCYFFKPSAEKVERMRMTEPFCAMLIEPWTPRSLADVKEQEKL